MTISEAGERSGKTERKEWLINPVFVTDQIIEA